MSRSIFFNGIIHSQVQLSMSKLTDNVVYKLHECKVWVGKKKGFIESLLQNYPYFVSHNYSSVWKMVQLSHTVYFYKACKDVISTSNSWELLRNYFEKRKHCVKLFVWYSTVRTESTLFLTWNLPTESCKGTSTLCNISDFKGKPFPINGEAT